MTSTTVIYTLSLHDALPILRAADRAPGRRGRGRSAARGRALPARSEEHTSELQSLRHLVCRLLLGKKKLAHRPGGGYEFAGWRIRPRWRLPQSWGLPVDGIFSAEVGFPRKQYEENSVTLELRPIIEKKLGRFQMDFNPVFSHALRGPAKGGGWDFEPGVRLA